MPKGLECIEGVAEAMFVDVFSCISLSIRFLMIKAYTEIAEVMSTIKSKQQKARVTKGFFLSYGEAVLENELNGGKFVSKLEMSFRERFLALLSYNIRFLLYKVT